MSEDYIVGLDIGSSKITAIVGNVKENDNIEVIGIGRSKSRGLRNGAVINLELTTDSISKAIDEAEVMAGIEISDVWIGIAGGHIKSINSKGMSKIVSSDREITRNDIERVIEAAKAVAIPIEKEIIHAIPKDFTIDGQAGIKDPIGMTGVRLEADIHIVTAAVTSAHNIIKSVNKAGYDVQGIILNPIASSYAVLSEDEKELGVILVDIGGGTTDIALFLNGSICFTESLVIGGENITKDISYGLRTNIEEAEKIKIKYGNALVSNYDPEETIEISGLGTNKKRTVRLADLGRIIEPRMNEIFSIMLEEIKKHNYLNSIATGMVITGGTAELAGIQEMAENILNLPARIGKAKNVSGLSDVIKSPEFATSVGLLKWIMVEKKYDEKGSIGSGKNIFSKILKSLKDVLNELFF